MEYNPKDNDLSTAAFQRAVIPSFPNLTFTNMENTPEDFNNLTDWMASDGTRFEHKHNALKYKGKFLMRALRSNRQLTDLQKLLKLSSLRPEILNDLVFTRSFGNLMNLYEGDYNSVKCSRVLEWLNSKIKGFEGVREICLTDWQTSSDFLLSPLMKEYLIDYGNSLFLGIPFAELA